MVASANLGVLGGLRDDVVVVDPADDEREGVKFKAAGRLLSSEGLIVICEIGDGKKTVYALRVYDRRLYICFHGTECV